MDINPLVKLKPSIVMVCILCISTIAMGLLYIFIFHRALFLKLDAFRLISISVAIVSPIVFFNALISNIIVFTKGPHKFDSEVITCFFLSAFFSLLILFISILFSYVINSVHPRQSLIYISVLEIIFIVAFNYAIRKSEKDSK